MIGENPLSTNEPSDPLTLEPVTVLTVVLTLTPVGVVTLTFGLIWSKEILYVPLTFGPPAVLAELKWSSGNPAEFPADLSVP